jgi:phosphate ABC transporter phosphate-binding protein
MFLLFLQIAYAQTAATNRIHSISVASFGEDATAAALRQKIIDRLNHSGQIKVVDNSADAELRGSSSIWAVGTVVIDPRSNASRQTNYQGYLSLELVDKSGQPLWSYLVTPGRFRTDSITQDLANHASERLLAALHSSTLRESNAPLTTQAQVPLHAAGGTLPQPLYLKWFESGNLPVTYDAVGSEDGIEQLAAGKVDFAASDMPLTPQSASVPIAVTQIPTVIGGVVPIYNLPGLNASLRFTPQILAGIYSGAIHRWNDPRIRAVNRDARLPNAEIAVIHRTDGSGTTFVWTSFLSEASPEWKSRAGSGTHVYWPIGIGATGNDGVAALVASTPNSIGYVELIYAIHHELNYAAVENPAGQFIKADLASITAAATEAAEPIGKDFRLSILNAPGKSAYPISTFTWLLIPTHIQDPQKKEAITAMLHWMLTSGQKECASLGYAPLPREVAARALHAIDMLQ